MNTETTTTRAPRALRDKMQTTLKKWAAEADEEEDEHAQAACKEALDRLELADAIDESVAANERLEGLRARLAGEVAHVD